MADLEFRGTVATDYEDLFTPAAREALSALAPLNAQRLALMSQRMRRREERHRAGHGPAFLDPAHIIDGTEISVAAARAGDFVGSPIPDDLQRQWIQGTGPAAKPRAPIDRSIRNVAYALLSGADGWMFGGEDALGQVQAMSLDNQRNIRLALARDEVLLRAAEQVGAEMNEWANGFFGRPIIADWRSQLDFTTGIFRARGLHLDDRHVRFADGTGLSASLVDLVLYVGGNAARLRSAGRSVVLYLPKIQTAAEAACWARLLDETEAALGLDHDTIKTYVLVEQIDAAFQLMEIRAALGGHFVGFNTGRWDYINSVADAMAGVPGFINPNIDAITMTYGYMRSYEDRVRRATNTADRAGGYALWQGGMEPNIPVGSPAGVEASMAKAVAGARRERVAGASGKWVAHWKMVHVVRPVWEEVGEANQLGRELPPLAYGEADAAALVQLEEAPRTETGARDLLSVAMQYGNAFGQGLQAAARKPADHFANDDVLYLMEDMATGEIRLSILWEWLRKGASLDGSGAPGGSGAPFSAQTFERLLDEEYAKLQAADNRDVPGDSKATTLPIARDIAESYVLAGQKTPWFIDLLNLTLDNEDRDVARERVAAYRKTLQDEGRRITANLEF